MKKVLWLCNTMLPELFSRFRNFNVKEGWLIGISNELRKQKDIEFHYICPQSKEQRIINIDKPTIHFHCFYVKYKNLYTVEEYVKEQIKKIIKEVQPDIIHIFGTEMPHTIACVDCVEKKDTIVISIQGLVSEYAKYYLKGIPNCLYLKGGFCNGKYQTILSQYREFCKRTDNEIRAIEKVKNVIGRTDWDKTYVNKINSKCKYYYCSETLRDYFYNKKWEIDKVERHTIFLSQGNYPIKGLHNLLAILPTVTQKYPDTKVYVAGSNMFLKDGTPYGIYIKNILKKKKLEKFVFFLGEIREREMCKRLLKAHVMVMPSNIENSPNSIGEAMLVGTPVIAAFVGGIPSIMQHGTEGLLYPPDSVDMLSYYICKIFEDDALAKKLSLNGRRRADNLYNREINLKCLLEIYDSIF